MRGPAAVGLTWWLLLEDQEPKPLVGGVQPVFPAHSRSELLTVAKPRCHARRGLGDGGSGDGTGHNSLGFGLDGKKKKINVCI